MTRHRDRLLFVFLSLPVGLSRAAVFSYECYSLPPDAGWIVVNEFCKPEQYIANGWLIQHTEMCSDPPAGQQIDYKKYIDEFKGSKHWFIEFRVFADGDQSEIPFTSPAAISASSLGPVFYQFVIARDRARLARNNPGETVYFDIDPAGAHVFRVEQYDVEWFGVYIDGQLLYSGVPGGSFPAYTPSVNTRAKSHATENWVYWDYIRWGDIPTDGSGDFDSNGQVNSFDHNYFNECISNSIPGANGGPGCRWADFDSDNDVDCEDLNSFRAAWTGTSDPPVACIATSVPAVSEWGFVVVTLLFLAAGCLIFRGKLGNGLAQ